MARRAHAITGIHTTTAIAACLQSSQHEARGSFYRPRAKTAAEGVGKMYSEAQRAQLLTQLRLEPCVLGYADDPDAAVACSDAETTALAEGRVTALLRDQYCQASSVSGGGPGTMQCPLRLDQLAPRADKPQQQRHRSLAPELAHPFHALARVRQAARARSINISAWDRGLSASNTTYVDERSSCARAPC